MSCPFYLKIQIALIQRNSQLRVVPELFFHNMPCLEKRLVKLPSEVGSLKSLLFSSLLFSSLQVLDVGGTEIIELPAKIAELDSLSHLEVSFYGSSADSKHAKLPSQLFSTLEALETLGISVCPGDICWHKSVKSLVKEVSNLKNLTSLRFSTS
ncbi:disease resistance protein [Gossypium australe]|uniref:Disease resistance protein n=1 Tax=Gossypium australe TaxID=47621 RepID=A0A5B6WGY8_9ROSI|nr:disease resistance protein [Gossypium australe]